MEAGNAPQGKVNHTSIKNPQKRGEEATWGENNKRNESTRREESQHHRASDRYRAIGKVAEVKYLKHIAPDHREKP